MKISLRRRASRPDTSQPAAIAMKGLTMAEVMMLPAVTDLVSAGKALGMGRTRSYELARAGTFPRRVLRIGRTYQVPTAGLRLLYAAYQLIALRGLRRGEARGLRWADLDLDAGLAYITRQVQRTRGKLTACPLKTPASRRVVALDPATIALLRAHRSAQQRDAQARGITPSGYVFTAPGGGPLCPEQLTRTFNKLVADTGLPPVRLHDLRHGAATLYQVAGRRGSEDHRRPARPLQHRSDSRHLPQRRHRTGGPGPT